MASSESNATVRIPNRSDLQARLLAVDNNPHLQEKLYPVLYESAGKDKCPEGVVMLLLLALYDYTRGIPPLMFTVMSMRADEFITALCGEDTTAADAAITHWNLMQAASKKTPN